MITSKVVESVTSPQIPEIFPEISRDSEILHYQTGTKTIPNSAFALGGYAAALHPLAIAL